MEQPDNADGNILRNGPPVVLAAAVAALAAAAHHIDPLAGIADFDLGASAAYLHDLLIAAACLAVAGALALLRGVARLRGEVQRLAAAEAGAHGSARSDPLTGLPNRRAFKERVDAALARLWPGLGIAVLLIDLDGFKSVNDIHGHDAGDLFLCEVAARLRAALSFGTYLARLGGDEFAVLVPYSLCHRAAQEGAVVVAALAEDIRVGDMAVSLGASVGIAFGPRDSSDTASLLRAADIAMYRAKEAGRGRCQLFHTAMEQELYESATLKAELRGAIAAGQLVPFYQPIVDLRDGRIVEFEVLVRWQHPIHGCLTPDRFIHLVESAQQGTPMLISLLQQVTHDVVDWPGGLRFSVNVFPAQLLDVRLIEAMSVAISNGGMLPSRFCIEVTESALVQDSARARCVIDAAHREGMTVALDDFGTGYSSLYHLRELAFDKLKIDRSFVQSIGADERNIAYVQAIIGLCDALNLEVTAEGIESGEIARLLAELRCDFGQGFLYAKPLPAGDARRLIPADAVDPTRLASAAAVTLANHFAANQLAANQLASV